MALQNHLRHVRPAAVAGYFYPGDAEVLRATIAGFLAHADIAQDIAPKAVIVPHAGYIYSGAIAAPAYAALARDADIISRVVMLGPTHRVYVRGLAVPSVDAFATPLGEIPLDRAAIDDLAGLAGIAVNDEAHAMEHSLEVHLPFLKIAVPRAALVPLAVGDAEPKDISHVLERLWGGPETRIIISSDLSHYLPYAVAQAVDKETATHIESLDESYLSPERACGCLPIAGLLVSARRHGLRIARLDLRSSGDTAGDRERVVGYGAWALYESR